MTTTALLVKTAAENTRLRERIAVLEGQVALAEKRAAVETELVAVARDPRAPLEMKPIDIDDFLAKRAQLEALPDLNAVKVAVKIASSGSYSVGDTADGVNSESFQSSKASKADRDFENSFLNHTEN